MIRTDKAQGQPAPASKEELKELIKESDEWVIGALITLYHLQDEDEKWSKTTRKLNSVGFNAFDAKDMTDISEFYLKRQYLTKPQIKYVRRTMYKYCHQLSQVGIKPLPNRYQNTSQKQWTEQKWAGLTGKGKEILIKFRFPKGSPRFMETLNVVKTIPGRRWLKEKKAWSAPLGIEAYEILKGLDFDIGPELEEWYQKMTQDVDDTNLEIPGLKMELYPFQKKGVAFIDSREGRALVADDMGLGKTAQALAWILLRKEKALPALVVAPANVKMKWEREIEKWTDIPSCVLFGRTNGHVETKYGDWEEVMSKGITLINYDILDGWKDTLLKGKFKTLVLDEVHYIKNSKALRTKATKKLAKKNNYLIELSGTPITNRPIEFWNALTIIRKDLFPYYWGFVNRYCAPQFEDVWMYDRKLKRSTKKRITKSTGASNTKELHDILIKTVMLRRKKSEVLPDLPDKTISVIPIPIDNREEYDRAERDLEKYIEEKEGKILPTDYPIWLARFEKLKQIAARGKMKAALKWMEDFLMTGEKLVTFAIHHEILDSLMEHEFNGGIKRVKIDGRTPTKKRDLIAESFQNDPEVKLFIGGLKAVKEGMDLYAASNSCLLELGWTPGEHNQAEDRLHRIGQKNAVTAWYLVAEHTIEEEIAALIDEKKEVLTMILDGEEVQQTALLTELIKKRRKKK